MQTKSSYRVLKWMFLAGMACSISTACVVTSGDGDDDDDLFDGGEGGTNTSTAGKTSGGGGSGGTTSGGSKADGGTPSTVDGGEPAAGGTPSTFVPGVCQETNDPIVPADQPLSLCDAAAGDDACMTCLKENACEQVMPCFGSNPKTACSTGMTEGADGQFECIRKCFEAGTSEATDAMDLLYECGVECDECGTGGPNGETLDLIEAGNDPAKCQAECFPFE